MSDEAVRQHDSKINDFILIALDFIDLDRSYLGAPCWIRRAI